MRENASGFGGFVLRNSYDLERIATRYAVYHRLPLHQAEDLLEDALVIALNRWAHDLDQATDDRRRAFVCTTINNLARNMARKDGKSHLCPPEFFDEDDSTPPERCNIDSVVFASAARDYIYELSRLLPEREQVVFHLTAIADLGPAEIAYHLQISKSAVGSALHRARFRIRQMLPRELAVELGLESGGGAVS